jgi:hypothetical protein
VSWTKTSRVRLGLLKKHLDFYLVCPQRLPGQALGLAIILIRFRLEPNNNDNNDNDHDNAIMMMMMMMIIIHYNVILIRLEPTFSSKIICASFEAITGAEKPCHILQQQQKGQHKEQIINCWG